MPVYIKFDGVDGRHRYSSLSELATGLRQRSGSYVLTSVAHGVRDPRLYQTLHELRALGVVESPARRPLGLEATGLGFIVIEARGGRAGLPVPSPLLLVIAQAQAQGMLVPAVQKVRDAASRLELPAGSSIYLGGSSAAAAGAAPHTRHAGWIVLDSASF